MASALTSSSNNWIGDGTGGKLSVEGSTLSFGSSTRGTPFNIRLDDDSISPSKSLFFEVEIVELSGSMAVGAVTKEKFLPGWKTKGVFYNGNLTNGSAGLLFGFGDNPAVGDTVGLYIQRADNGVKIIFYLNGNCLGEGFRLEGETEVFYPCIHLDGFSVLKYRAPEAFPSETSRQPRQRTDAYSGDWKLVKAFSGPELGEYPLPKDSSIILNFYQAGEHSYRLSVEAGNTMNMTVNIMGKVEAFDKIKVGMVMSTKMMPPPELAAVESYLSSSLPELQKMIVSENGELLLTGVTTELLSQPYEKKFEPLSDY